MCHTFDFWLVNNYRTSTGQNMSSASLSVTDCDCENELNVFNKSILIMLDIKPWVVDSCGDPFWVLTFGKDCLEDLEEIRRRFLLRIKMNVFSDVCAADTAFPARLPDCSREVQGRWLFSSKAAVFITRHCILYVYCHIDNRMSTFAFTHFRLLTHTVFETFWLTSQVQ